MVDEPKAVTIDLPGADTEDEKPKSKGRGRPKGSTGSKKKKATKKPADDTQLKMLLMTASNILASREGMHMWALSPAELDQLAPAINEVLALHEGVGAIQSEYAPYITLITVAFIVFIPKYLQFKEENKNKPKKVKNRATVQPARSTQQQQGGPTSGPHGQTATDGGPRGQTHERNAPRSKGFGSELHELFPVLG